jgi:hypothetical protein
MGEQITTKRIESVLEKNYTDKQSALEKVV